MWQWPTIGEEILEEFAKFGEVAREYTYRQRGNRVQVLNIEVRRVREHERRVRERGYEMSDLCAWCFQPMEDLYDKNGRRTKRRYHDKCRWQAYNNRMKLKEGKNWRYLRRKARRQKREPK